MACSGPVLLSSRPLLAEARWWAVHPPPCLCLCLLHSLCTACWVCSPPSAWSAVQPQVGCEQSGGTLQAKLQQDIEAGVRCNRPPCHSHCMLTMLFVRCQEMCFAAGDLKQVPVGTPPCLHIALPA